MAELPLSPPPELGPDAKYSDYRGWLLDNFFCELCSYCLQQYRSSLSIDHYVPRSHAAARVHDPRNLLLSCQNCGRQKSDYHPHHHGRRRLPQDDSGFLVLDVRVDNLAHLFELQLDGSLLLQPGLDPVERRRASWNVALLGLDLHDDERARLIEKLRLVEELRTAATLTGEPLAGRILEILERDLSERLPMLNGFDVPITPPLRDRLNELAEQACGSHQQG